MHTRRIALISFVLALGVLVLYTILSRLSPEALSFLFTAFLSFLLSFVMGMLAIYAFLFWVTYQVPENTVALVYRRTLRHRVFDRLAGPGEVLVGIPFLVQVRQEIPLRIREVRVAVHNALTADQYPMHCTLYVTYRVDPRILLPAAEAVEPPPPAGENTEAAPPPEEVVTGESEITDRTPPTLLEFRDFDEERWRRQVQRAVHEALNATIGSIRFRKLRGSEGYDEVRRQVLERAAQSLRPWGVVLEDVTILELRPGQRLQQVLDRLSTASAQGEAVFKQLRELGKRMKIKVENSEDLLMLALAALLSENGEHAPNIAINITPSQQEESE